MVVTIYVCALTSLLLVSISSATLTIRNVVNDELKAYPSAVFRYFSDREDDRLENYQVISLEGKDLCTPTRELVAGKIVLANLAVGAVIDCWPVDAARTCAMYGAVAFVTISFYSPPGLVSNIHWTFNPNAESVGIPYVGIAALDVGDVDLKQWRRTKMDGMVATLAPPYVHAYSDLFKSPLWLIIFQIFLPTCALIVSSESIAEIRRRIRIHAQERSCRRLEGLPTDRSMLASASTLICTVEALSGIAIGAILVLGEFGPLYLPYSFHYFFMLLLTGSSNKIPCASSYVIWVGNAFKYEFNGLYSDNGDRRCSCDECICLVHYYVSIFRFTYWHIILSGNYTPLII